MNCEKKTSDKIADDADVFMSWFKKMCHTCIQNYLDALKFACDVQKIESKSFV